MASVEESEQSFPTAETWLQLSAIERALLIAVATAATDDAWGGALIDQTNAFGVEVTAQHGYRVLHQLAADGLLAEWQPVETMTIYQLTPAGKQCLEDGQVLLTATVDSLEVGGEG